MPLSVDIFTKRFDEKILGEKERSELEAFITEIRGNAFPKEFYGQTREGKLIFVKKFNTKKRAIILKDATSKQIIGYYIGSNHDEYMNYLRKIK